MFSFLAKNSQTSLWRGSITHVDEKKLDEPAAQVFNQIVEHVSDIKTMLATPTQDLLALIADYNPALLKTPDMFENWLRQCESNASEFNVPIRKWIENKPEFLFSKK